MTFRSIWIDSAVDKLATAWLDSDDRNGVTAAAAKIDRTLSEDPDTVGRRTFDNVREFLCPPLGVEFEVVEEDRIVYVLSVWLID